MNKIRPDCFRAGLCSLVYSKHLRVITLKLHLICKCLLCSVSCLASLLAFPAAASSFFGRCEQVLSMRTLVTNFLIVPELQRASGRIWGGQNTECCWFCTSYTALLMENLSENAFTSSGCCFVLFFVCFPLQQQFPTSGNLSILSKDKAPHSFLMQLYWEELYQELVWVAATHSALRV